MTASPAACWNARSRRRQPGSDRESDRLPGVDVTKLRDTVQRAMTRGAGVVRSAESLAVAGAVVEDAAVSLGDPQSSVAAGELANLLRVAEALLASATARTESRGAHARREYPESDPAWRLRLVHGAVGHAEAVGRENDGGAARDDMSQTDGRGGKSGRG